MKTNKSLTKRIKLTKNGKMKTLAKGRCHYNAKERQNSKSAKNKLGDFIMSAKDKSRFLPKK